MLLQDSKLGFEEFLTFIKDKCSPVEYQNWFAPISVKKETEKELTLEVPNIFVQEYLLSNYKRELSSFLPTDEDGELAIRFVIAEQKAEAPKQEEILPQTQPKEDDYPRQIIRLNQGYTFNQFIEGPSNQFVKSAALGVATRPGKSYNPLFIHGGVGLGKTHLLHSIGHSIKDHHKKTKA